MLLYNGWLNKKWMECCAASPQPYKSMIFKSSIKKVHTISRCMETQPVVPSAPTVILPNYSVEQLKAAQEEDPIAKQLQIALNKSVERLNSCKWKTPPLYHYQQLWPQLELNNGIVYHKCSPGPLSTLIDVPNSA